MRPAGKGALESLYFDYPQFEARRVPELEGKGATRPVAIVGAGPVGMAAALALARYGVRSVLLDSKSTFNDGSRAICIARQSMHLLRRIGAVDPFERRALGWVSGRSYYRGHEILKFDMPHSADERYLPMYNLQQQYIESYLYDAVAASPLIDMRWQSEVTGLVQRGDGVTLKVASPPGDYDLDAQWVLAADGARSPIRGMMGLRLKGENYEGRYVIADVKMARDFPTERRAYFEPAGNPGGTVLLHKQPDDIWRVDYQLRDDENVDDALREENIRARVKAILDDIGDCGAWELEWWSVYTANTLCLDAYRHGRVIFIGDSGHIVPIFGVRGLNNGIADAHNIGWKLGYLLNGQAGERLIDSYSPERRGATLDVFANASKSARFMTPPTRGWALAREAALSLAVRHPFAGKLADPRNMLPYTYGDSPITLHGDRDGAFARGPQSGAAALDVRLGEGDFLLDHAGNGFTGLLFASATSDRRVEDAFATLGRLDPHFTLIAVGGGSAPDGARRLAHGSERVMDIYGAAPGSFYLLRPDLHVAGRWREVVPDEVVAQMRACLGLGNGDVR